MHGEMILYIIWIPGTRMIECGIDGLSRGTTNQCVLEDQGKILMNFIPLKLNMVERSKTFWPWIQGW